MPNAASALANGRYRLVAVLGEGGQATVYRAWDTRLAVWRAVKVLLPDSPRALRQRFEAIRRAELDRLQPKIAGLPPDARARVDEITRLIIEKLLITPTEQLKALPDRELQHSYADALSHLFALAEPGDKDDEDDEPGQPPAGSGPRELARS